MNRTLMAAFGDIGINAFAIISYLSSFTMAVFFGASEGIQPLSGQAYGAKEDNELKQYYRAGQFISVTGSAYKKKFIFMLIEEHKGTTEIEMYEELIAAI